MITLPTLSLRCLPWRFTAASAALAQLLSGAQPAAPAPAGEVVELSAFNVRDTRTSAYAAQEAVSTTRISVPIQDVPQTVSVVTRELIDDTLGNRMLDVAKYVTPVMESSLSTGGDRVTLRGFQVSQRFVDGVNISGVDGYNMASDTTNVERLEVIKGPNAILVPGGSPGGIINQITKSPQFRDATQLTVTLKEYIGSLASVDVNRVFAGGKAAVRVVGTVWDSEGYFREQFRQGWLFAPSFTRVFGNGVQFTSKLETLYNKETQGIGAVIDPTVGTSTGGYARVIPGMARNNAWGPHTDNRERRETRWINELTFKVGAATSARLWLMADHAEREDWGAPGGVPTAGFQGNRNPQTGEWEPFAAFGPAPTFTRTTLTRNNATTYNRSGQGNLLIFDELHLKNDYAVELTPAAGVKSTTIFGLSANYQKVKWKNWSNARAAVDLANPVWDTPITTSALLRDKKGAQQDFQVFAYERLSLLNDRLILAGGASQFWGVLERLDNGNLPAVVSRSLSKSVTDANLGVIFKPQRNLSFFAGYNKVGGALPTSILAGETSANFIIQTGDQLEAGVKSTLLNGRVTTSFSWFDIAQSNFQVPNSAFNIDPRQPQFLFQDLTSTGYEFEFTALLNQQLLLVGNFIHLRMRDPNGVRQRMVPDNAAALFLKYEVAGVKGLAVTLGLDYMGSAPGEQASGITAASTATKVIPNQPSFYVAPRTVANLGVSYRRDHWTTRVSIDNVLDKDYIQSAGSRNTLVSGLPRTWAVSLAYKF
jgi:iron complex outermembrane receptor protein